jgi:hypothetical protein
MLEPGVGEGRRGVRDGEERRGDVNCDWFEERDIGERSCWCEDGRGKTELFDGVGDVTGEV